MNLHLRRWLQISIFNLLLVAFVGVIMRYKIVFSLPFVNQQYLLHGHSHFAFAGWVTQALMSLLVFYLYEKGDTVVFKKYKWVLYANLFTAYGMFLTFLFQGYALLSIIFSVLSIVVSYLFAVKFWKDLNRSSGKTVVHNWFKAAVLFNALSSLGALSLAFMLATKTINTERYLAWVYFFLHFQYNGWFFFACMGLLTQQLNKYLLPAKKLKTVFVLFAVACIPAYFLSALWIAIPQWVYISVVIAVFMQLAGWFMLIQLIRKYLFEIIKNLTTLSKGLFLLCALALTIKLFLQASAVIPSLSDLAYSFRPIVIGYLHLVLLGVITLFILSYCIAFKLVHINKITTGGMLLFTSGIIVNEILLMIHGVADMDYKPVPFINELLLAAALILFAGMFIMNYGQKISNHNPAHKLTKNS